MAATATLVSGPNNMGPNMKVATYTVLMDTSYPTGGEAIDLTGEFDYVYGVIPAGNDTAADNGYTFHGLCPGVAVAVTTTNVLIMATWDGDPGTDTVNPEVANTTDLSAVGALQIVVFGA